MATEFLFDENSPGFSKTQKWPFLIVKSKHTDGPWWAKGETRMKYLQMSCSEQKKGGGALAEERRHGVSHMVFWAKLR